MQSVVSAAVLADLLDPVESRDRLCVLSSFRERQWISRARGVRSFV